jgi:hypothetical protein
MSTSTSMAWMWSSTCLALLSTSTQSSNLKWPSGRGKEGPMQQTIPLAKRCRKHTVKWTDAPLYIGNSLSGNLPCRTTFVNLADVIHPVHWPMARNWPSVHLVLKAFTPSLFVLDQIIYQMNWCLHLVHHRFIRWSSYQSLHPRYSISATKILNVGSSDSISGRAFISAYLILWHLHRYFILGAIGTSVVC